MSMNSPFFAPSSDLEGPRLTKSSLRTLDRSRRDSYDGVTGVTQAPAVSPTRDRRGSIPKENPPSPARVTHVRPVCCRFLGALPACQDDSASETTATTSGEKDNDDNLQYIELQYKRPKKKFRTKEEQQEFIRNYTAKKKTELCKNWEVYGKCRFGDQCSFAHGEHELRKKNNLMSTFKTRQCTQFNETMFCPYGLRCQYIHNPYTPERQRAMDYTKVLKENSQHAQYRLEALEDGKTPAEYSEHLFYISVYYKYAWTHNIQNRRRLGVFSRLAHGRTFA